jgi:hypothetical protein
MTERDQQQRIAQLLDAYQALREKQASAGQVNGDENLFALFDVGTDEVTHSALLAWLFDPTGAHGQGARFLRAFLSVARPDIALQLPETYRVETELSRMRSIIDIAAFKAERFVLYIENKTTSPDTPGQHDREIADLRRLGATLQVPVDRQIPIYLTPYGRQARGENSRVWHRVAYRDLAGAFAQVLDDGLNPRTHLLLKDWLETVKTFSGGWKETMTDFSESSVLLGANWPTVLDIEQARTQLDEELHTLLFSLEGDLAQQAWWQHGWVFRRHKGRSIYIGPPQWQDVEGHWPLWMGVYSFNGDHVFGPKTPPVFYFRCRKNYDALGDVLREKLRTEGNEVLDNHRHLVHRAVLQCPHERTAVKSYPVQVREQLVALFTEYVDFAMRHEDIIQAHVKQKS